MFPRLNAGIAADASTHENVSRSILPLPRRRFDCIRMFAFAMIVAGTGSACTAVELPPKEAKRHSDVVFRGTITAYRDSGTGYKMAVIRVSRVWKGDAGRMVELSTFPGYSDAPCAYFSTTLIPEGTDVIVFARKVRGRRYLTGYWSAESAKDYPNINQLGRGRAPAGPY